MVLSHISGLSLLVHELYRFAFVLHVMTLSLKTGSTLCVSDVTLSAWYIAQQHGHRELGHHLSSKMTHLQPGRTPRASVDDHMNNSHLYFVLIMVGTFLNEVTAQRDCSLWYCFLQPTELRILPFGIKYKMKVLRQRHC